jgi:hypothetical protein
MEHKIAYILLQIWFINNNFVYTVMCLTFWYIFSLQARLMDWTLSLHRTKSAVCSCSLCCFEMLASLKPLIDGIWYDIFNCNLVATRWQKYSTHIHTNNTQNDTKQTIHRTTQKLGRVRAVPRLCGWVWNGSGILTQDTWTISHSVLTTAGHHMCI